MDVFVENLHNFSFNQEIRHLTIANTEFELKQAIKFIRGLGDLFIKHNLFTDFGLTLIHRHFDINADEILVESFTKSKELSSTMPWKITDNVAAPNDNELWSSLDLTSKRYIVPQSWILAKSGILTPFEYLASDSLMKPPSAQFVSELFNRLENVGLEKIVGLRRIQNRQGTFSWETTPNGVRANITKFGPKPEDLHMENMIPVVWYFDKNGDIFQSDWCMLHSGSVCHCKDKTN